MSAAKPSCSHRLFHTDQEGEQATAAARVHARPATATAGAASASFAVVSSDAGWAGASALAIAVSSACPAALDDASPSDAAATSEATCGDIDCREFRRRANVVIECRSVLAVAVYDCGGLLTAVGGGSAATTLSATGFFFFAGVRFTGACVQGEKCSPQETHTAAAVTLTSDETRANESALAHLDSGTLGHDGLGAPHIDHAGGIYVCHAARDSLRVILDELSAEKDTLSTESDRVGKSERSHLPSFLGKAAEGWKVPHPDLLLCGGNVWRRE